MQCVHVFVANTLLFGYQIYLLMTKTKKESIFGENPIRKLVFV